MAARKDRKRLAPVPDGLALSDALGRRMAGWKDVQERRVFGRRAFFVNEVLFAVLDQANLALRLPEERRAEALASFSGAHVYQPRGHAPFSRWAALPTLGRGADWERLVTWARIACRSARRDVR